MNITQKLDRIDEILIHYEDWMHGEDGNNCTEARILITEIKEEVSKKSSVIDGISSRTCFKCEAEIKPLYTEHHHKPESSMWDGGIVDKISAGYGSLLDGNMYIISICDKCAELLDYCGNYMETKSV